MQGEILLKLVTVLTPDDVRRMRAAGLGDLAKKHIDGLDKLATGWQGECGPVDSKIWAEVQIRLNELRATCVNSGIVFKRVHFGYELEPKEPAESRSRLRRAKR